MSGKKNHERGELYYDLFYEQVDRLLALLDRDETSQHFGCFDRNFWLHRNSDFPSAARQMGIQPLAHIWNDSRSSYYHNPQLLKWIIGSIKFTLTIQKSDGSYDEWYPGERGWAGPTAYILSAMAKTYEIVRLKIPSDLDLKIHENFRRSIRHLLYNEEKDVLANHQALAIAAIAEARLLLGEAVSDLNEIPAWHSFKKSLHDEGWSLEYDGADPGYQTATLSFLARAHRACKSNQIVELIESQLEFIKYFFYPNGEFAGIIGSRSTSNLFVYGFEYWSSIFPMALALARASADSLIGRHAPSPKDQEDHYLIYRMGEFFEASVQAKASNQTRESDNILLPYEEKEADKKFPAAGLIVRGNNFYYLVLSVTKGGSLLVFSKLTKKLVFVSSGLYLQCGTKKWSSAIANEKTTLSILTKSLKVTGYMHEVKSPTFTPLTFVLFRIFMLLFSRSANSSILFKHQIRKALMTAKILSKISFSREIMFEEKSLCINDQLIGLPAAGRYTLWNHGIQHHRLVPQSRYRHDSDFNSVDKQEFDAKNGASHHQTVNIEL